MLLVTFIEGGKSRLGILDRAHDEVVDLSRVAPGQPPDMLAFIALGESGLAEARRALASRTGRLPLAQVRLTAPIPKPARNIFCVGKNYREHAQELQAAGLKGGGAEAIPELPIFFTKATSSVIGSGEPIPAWLDPTNTTDYEGELAMVIGPGGRGIARAEAMRHVYGYTIVNDVTSRALQRRHQQWFLGKSLTGYCPVGPFLVTADEFGRPDAQELITTVNGERRQHARLRDLIFDVPAIVEAISAYVPLEPGDLIATGTPAGVGIGFKPPRYLKPGDTVTVSISGIGELTNPVV